MRYKMLCVLGCAGIVAITATQAGAQEPAKQRETIGLGRV
jgi:hypothetical protein